MLKGIEFLRKKSREKVEGGKELSFLAPAILCPVHRIFWQQVTNLVNKFALLLQRSMFREDSRDKPENDECRGRLLSAVCKSVKCPSPEAYASTSPAGGEVSYGRSMIEMLGVLAIIAVLSVGGIAGYSKAMEKYKISKAINEYSNLIFGLLEHKNDLEKLPNDTAAFSEIARSLNLVPPSWTNAYLGGLRDDLGNIIRIKNNYLYRVEIIFNNRKKTSKQFISQCRELVSGLIYPLQNVLILSYIWREKTANQGENEFWYGSKNCTADEKCIRDVTLSDIEQQCMSCLETGDCLLLLHF